VESADGGAELDVGAVPVEDLGATEDGEVLKFGSPALQQCFVYIYLI